MSSIQVLPIAISEASARLGGIADHVHEMHGQVGSHLDAAQGTHAAGALQGLMGQWAHVLPVYAEAGARLSAALGGAATGYARSDRAVADACDGPSGEPAR